MQLHLAAAIGFALILPGLPSQEPAPAAVPDRATADQGPELLRPFEAFVGRWKGEGSFSPTPDGATQPFSATAESRWILDGRFLQEDAEIDLGTATPFLSRTVFGWDGARERFVAISLDNRGRSELAEVSWTRPDTLVAVETETVDGRPVVVRTVWTFDDGHYTFRMDRAVGDGAFYRALECRFERVDELPPRSADVSFRGAAIGAEMARLARLVGEFTIDGEQIDPDGRTLARFRGRDALRPMYGGQVIAAVQTVESAGGTRIGHRYATWDPIRDRYQVFSIDDLGGVGTNLLRWDGEDWLIGESAAALGDETTLGSTLVEVTPDGPRRIVSRTVRATGEPVGEIVLRYTSTGERK